MASTSWSPAPYTGTWEGEIEVAPETTMGLHFRVAHKDGEDATCFMDSPAQKTVGIVASIGPCDERNVRFTVAGVGHFSGTIDAAGKTLTGDWNQGGVSYPLELTRTRLDAEPAADSGRPQYPKDPLPYRTVALTVPGDAEDVQLSGTLTIPDGEHVATAVLLAGSGPQTRDQHVGGHHTFRVLADALTKQGIATFRYDKRGVGESKGDYSSATLVDFGRDAAAAVRHLSRNCSDIDATVPIGIIGHSEGGLTGPIAAMQEKEAVKFVVLMASMAMNGKKLQARQSEAIATALGVPPDFSKLMEEQLNAPMFDAIIAGSSKEEVTLQISKLAEDFAKNLPENLQALFPADQVDGFVEASAALYTPWFQHFFQYDPKPTLELLASSQPLRPVLAMNGDKDLQVLPENLAMTSDIFQACGHDRYTAKEFPGKNHLFQACTTGTHLEYPEIEESFSEEVSSFVADWVRKAVV